jgi:hypothetical protein
MKRYKDGECSNVLVEKPYVCDSCGARFQLRKSLRRHSCHRLYNDDVNTSTITKKYGIIENQEEAAEQGVHMCNKCGAAYPSDESLRRHILRKHPGIK